MLVNKSDPEFAKFARWQRQGNSLPAHEQACAVVWSVKSGKNLDEGGFPGAVLPQQSMHFATRNVERDAGQHLRRAEMLGQSFNP